MAETVKLTRALVTSLKKDAEAVLREFKTDKGPVIFSFRVETRVNDKVDNSPRLFRKCSFFAKTTEEEDKIRKLVTKGSLLEIEGVTNRRNFEDRDTKAKVYYDEISVHNLTAIQVGDTPAELPSDELPF